MLYVLILLHVLADKIIQPEKWRAIKLDKPEYLILYNFIYTVILASFYAGYTREYTNTLVFALLLFFIRTAIDNVLSTMIEEYEKQYTKGSNVPNIGSDSITVIHSFTNFIVLYFIFTFPI